MLAYQGTYLLVRFVHILPSAVSALSTPCLPTFFTQTFPAFAYLLTMVSALILHLLEWITVQINIPKSVKEKMKTAKERGAGVGHAHAQRENESIDLQVGIKSSVSTFTLEAAVGIHSIIIGLTLGVSTAEFISLWIALTFHQFFEGIGVGFRIAEAKTHSTLAAFVTGAVFSFTTPFGIGIGIGISVAASSSGTRALIAEGVFEAVAAGLLLDTALVSLTVEEFAASDFHKMKQKKMLFAFLAFYMGISAMAVIAIWA